jgi:solute carrier family 25 protein 39/40
MEKDGKVRCEQPAFMARIVSGSIGSVVTTLFVTPLEVVKVRMQNSRQNHSKAIVSLCPRGCGTFVVFNGHMDCVLPKNSASFFDQSTGEFRNPCRGRIAKGNQQTRAVGTFSMMRSIWLNEGISGMYAGLRPALVMAVPNTVLYFSAYEEIVWRLRHRYPESPVAGTFPLIAGASARVIASVVTAPFELLRTRQAAATGENRIATGLTEEFRNIVRQEGPMALYKGLKPTLWRDVPFSAIYWFFLERFREYWKTISVNSPSPAEQACQAFLSGATAGLIAAACTTPFDVIKTRQQAANINVSLGAEVSVSLSPCCHQEGALAVETPVKIKVKVPGTFQLLRQVAEQEGISVLWRGNQARMMKIAPACAIMISSYEFGKRILE